MSRHDVKQLLKELNDLANPEIAEHSQRFFKTGPGEYGEGDRFLGIRVPVQRKVARKYSHLSLEEIDELLQSPWHEVRLTALIILVRKYEKADRAFREQIFRFYIDHLNRINNWDLVDTSAGKIVGHYLYKRDRKLLFELAESKNIWKRRVGIIATGYFIAHGDLEDTYRIASILLHDESDLIHKAVGWMIRETGKRNRKRMEEFLSDCYRNMPRTMLRYSIEHLPEPRRQEYLKGTA